MTIDEAIKHAKENAEKKFAEGMLCHANPNDEFLDKCIDCAREHEQLAEWLEELKTIRQWKADVMESFCKYDASSFEELVGNTKNETIDELVNILIGYFNGFSHEVYAQVSVNFICDNIKIIAEKVKGE